MLTSRDILALLVRRAGRSGRTALCDRRQFPSQWLDSQFAAPYPPDWEKRWLNIPATTEWMEHGPILTTLKPELEQGFYTPVGSRKVKYGKFTPKFMEL